MAAALLFVVGGIGLLIAPFVVKDFPIPSAVSVVGGVATLCMGALMNALRLYVKTSANRAFVRTGAGGVKVVLDGGAMVVPALHNIIPVSLETMKLQMIRFGEGAFMTQDNLPLNLQAVFFVRVDDNSDDVLTAARSFGERGAHPETMFPLIGDKIEATLRRVITTMNWAEISSQCENFTVHAVKHVREDLKRNGVTLESATIALLEESESLSLAQAVQAAATT
ncbi:MAG: SPFH domain-containing protein [Abditibacteriales bacterium]|nr:SPFH domain-containing protein [Abditibacteriales bacterium]MDW8364453.1 SPFH domain-containing protein [Abditibacteriales bacterium]